MSEPPVTPEGHILLLVKAGDGKTFKDYRSIYDCLESVVEMYEEYRTDREKEASGDLKDFQRWLDSLDELDCFQYSREINRYRFIPRSDFRNLFDSNEENETPASDDLTTNDTNSAHNKESSNPVVTNVFNIAATNEKRGLIPTTNGTTNVVVNGIKADKTVEPEDEDRLDYDDDDDDYAWDG